MSAPTTAVRRRRRRRDAARRPARARRSAAAAVVARSGLVAFGWPLLVSPGSGLAARAPTRRWCSSLLLPLLLAVVLAELADGGMDAKAVAMLGVLAAVGAALRPLGAGTAGIETVFFLLVLAGRVFGPGFGFVLGSMTLFASALLTGGRRAVAAVPDARRGWVGFGAGLLPPAARPGRDRAARGYGARRRPTPTAC